MIDPIFNQVAKVIGTRRPAWAFIIEDSLIRIMTKQFIVDWDIIDEILEDKDYKMEEVVMHQALGIVICIRNIKGT